MTPEGRVKENVKKLLRQYECYWHAPVQNGMGAPALDFMQVTCGGAVCAIETKAPGKRPTARQVQTITSIRRAGGTVFITDGEMEEIERWLIKSRLLHLADDDPASLP